MKFLEKTIENIIFTTSRPQLKERGLDVKGYLKRQVRLGPYGILDLISIYPCRDTYHNTGKLHFIITVYELKLKDVSERTFWQCCQYTKIIQLGIENTYGNRISFDINLVLIGDDMDDDNLPFATGIFNNLKVYNYSYEFDGIKFNELRLDLRSAKVLGFNLKFK